MTPARTGRGVSEDWLSVWIGRFCFVLSLGVFADADVLGWAVTTTVWIDPGASSSACWAFSSAAAFLPAQ